MLPNEKQLRALVKKIKANADKKYEAKQSKKTNVEEPLDNSESLDMFQEMKKLPFSE